MSGGNVPPYVGGPWTVDRTGPDLIFRAPVRSGPVQHAPMLGPVRSRSCSLSPGPVRSGPVALGGSVHGPGWTESCLITPQIQLHPNLNLKIKPTQMQREQHELLFLNVQMQSSYVACVAR